MQATTSHADTTPLPERVRDKPSEAIPLVEQRLTDAYGVDVAEIVLNQLLTWDNTGYSSEYTGVLWSVAADETGLPISPHEDVQMGVEAWRTNQMVYQSVQFAENRERHVSDSEAVEAAVRDVMELSRSTLYDRLGQTVTAYRGIYETVWDERVDEVDGGVRVSPLSMEAWTLSREFAENHGKHTIQRRIPVENVLFFGELFQERQFYRMREVTVGHNGPYTVPNEDILPRF